MQRMNNDELRTYLVQLNSLKAFCRETGLAYSTMCQFRSGYRKELKPLTRMALMNVIFMKGKK